jgi:hypothetical protein
MLRPLIASFINFHYNDYIVLSVIFEVFLFLFEFYYAGTRWWHFLIQAAISVELAFLARMPQSRQWQMFTLFPKAAGPGAFLQVVCAVLLCLPLGLYENRIHDPMNSLQMTFYIGAVHAMVLMLVLVMIVEGIGYFFKQPSCQFRLLGQHQLGYVVSLAIAAIDGLAFMGGYRLVLTTVAWMIATSLLGFVFNYVLAQ